MAVLRQGNWLGQARVDVPFIRSVESAVCGDFDALAGKIMAGGRALVVTGFEVITVGAIGSAASSLQMSTSGGALLNYLATESGTIFTVPTDRGIETLNSSNSRVSGSFTAGQVNYVGVDIRRATDADTSDLVQFLDPNTNLETPRTVPLARTADYLIVIGTQDFTSTPALAPVAKITTNSSNIVTAIEDCRNMAYRLAEGGTTPDNQSSYGWPGTRFENLTGNVFAGGDKAISSQKDWMDAMMTRLWEIGGGIYWYSATADRNLQLTRTGAAFTNGEWFEWDGVDLHWKGLSIVFENSGTTIWYNTISNQIANSAGLTDLADGECIYVDVDRSSNATITAVKGVVSTLGTPAIPGARHIVAWRVGTSIFTKNSSFPVGSTFQVATNTALGIVQLTYAAGNPLLPLVAPQDANGSIYNTATGGNGFGLRGTSNGNGTGVVGISAAGGNGFGMTATAGVGGNGTGLQATGRGAGYGVEAIAGATGVGVYGTGGATSGTGVRGDGGATSSVGVYGLGGSTNGRGVEGLGSGSGAGVYGTGGGSGGEGVIGIGGASGGHGVIGVGGNLFGVGGDFTGGSEGTALATHGVSTSVAPQIASLDSAGNGRALVDYTGFRMGRATEFEEHWLEDLSSSANNTSICTNWIFKDPNATGSFDTRGAGEITFTSTYPASTVVLTQTAAAAGHVTYIQTQNAMVLNTDDVVAVMEWEMALSDDATANGFDVKVGLTHVPTNGGSPANNENCLAIVKRDGDTNYQLERCNIGSAFALTDTGIPPSAPAAGIGSFDRFRIEFHGVNTALGGLVRAFVNDNLVGSAAAPQPFGNGGEGMFIVIGLTYVSANEFVAVGPIRISFNRVLSLSGN